MKQQAKHLYGKLRTGAKVYSKAVEIFGKTPQKSLRQLFSEAVKGNTLTRNQRQYLRKSLARLKRNYTFVEKASKNLSASDLLDIMFRNLNIKPSSQKNILTDSKIKEILKETSGKKGIVIVTQKHLKKKPVLGKDAFGLMLKIDSQNFKKIIERVQQLGLAIEGNYGGITVPLVSSELSKGMPSRVPLTIVPEEKNAQIRKTVEMHETEHRQQIASEKTRPRGLPKNRTEAREHLSKDIKMELEAYITEKNTQGFIK